MQTLDRFLQDQRIKRASVWIDPGTTILDVGCFQGELLAANSHKIRGGYGIDPLLFKEITRDNFVLIPGKFPQDLPTSTGLFDVIAALAVFEHITTLEQVMFAAKCFDLLNDRGRVILTIPSERVDKILKLLQFLKVIDGMSTEEHHGFQPENAIGLFLASGFELEYSKSFQLGLNNLFVFRKH